jgi:hypothetical protein
VNTQTHSRLFEHELSPILEDVHAVDYLFGYAEPVKGSRTDQAFEYDSDTSYSSFGSLLEVQASFNNV